MTREERLTAANELLEVISSCGRNFFRYQDRVARIEEDCHKRLWFVDDFSEKRIFLHCSWSQWQGFSHGGTLKDLIRLLKDFVVHEKLLSPWVFGPWPDWYCGGDLWGYGEDNMEKIRKFAKEKGITVPVCMKCGFEIFGVSYSEGFCTEECENAFIFSLGKGPRYYLAEVGCHE